LFPFKGFYCTKSFQNPLVLCSKPFGKLKKFPFKGLFPFDGFPFNEYELYTKMPFFKAFFHGPAKKIKRKSDKENVPSLWPLGICSAMN